MFLGYFDPVRVMFYNKNQSLFRVPGPIIRKNKGTIRAKDTVHCSQCIGEILSKQFVTSK